MMRSINNLLHKILLQSRILTLNPGFPVSVQQWNHTRADTSDTRQFRNFTCCDLVLSKFLQQSKHQSTPVLWSGHQASGKPWKRFGHQASAKPFPRWVLQAQSNQQQCHHNHPALGSWKHINIQHHIVPTLQHVATDWLARCFQSHLQTKVAIYHIKTDRKLQGAIGCDDSLNACDLLL